MTPENKDVAGLLPSSEGAVKVVPRGVYGPDGGRPGEPYGNADWIAQNHEAVIQFLERSVAAPGAAIAAREQEETDDAREAFETYLRGTLKIDVQRYSHGGYQWADARTAWHVWKKARSLASLQAAAVASGEPACTCCGCGGCKTCLGGRNRCAKHAPLASPSGAGLGGAVASSEAMTMIPMESDDGRKGWYVQNADFYLDIEQDANGKWSAFFRHTYGGEAFADQASQPGCAACWAACPAMTTYVPTCPACRAGDVRTFYRNCQGCQARRALLATKSVDGPVN